MVTVHFSDCDNNALAGSGNFTYNAYNYSNKVANITKACIEATVMKLSIPSALIRWHEKVQL